MNNATNTATVAPKIAVVTKSPPPKGSNLKPRQKGELQLIIESMQPGQCLEYRGELTHSNIIARAHKAKEFTGKKYAVRKVNGGTDLYCVEGAAV